MAQQHTAETYNAAAARLKAETARLKAATTRFVVLPPSVGVDANWHVTDQDDLCVAHCFGFAHDIKTGEPLARRIAAALNACRGIPNEELEKWD